MAEAFRLHIWNGETDEAKKLDNWLSFPCSAEESKANLKESGFTDGQIKNFVITGYSSKITEYHNLSDYLFCRDNPDNPDGYVIREDIDELNYLAQILSNLNADEKTAFSAAVEAGEHNTSVAELINLALNTECYNVIPDIYGWDDYGKHVAVEENNINIDNLGDLEDYIDFEKYGDDYAKRNGGILLDSVFLQIDKANYVERYDGDTKTTPYDCQITMFLDENVFVENKVMESFSLASSLDRFFTAHDKDYANKPSVDRTVELSNMLVNGDLQYIKSMLNNLGDEILLGEVAEYERKFIRLNPLANAEKHTEQNFNQIDGQINNEPPKKEEKPSIRLMLKIIVQEVKENKDKDKDHKLPQKTEPSL